MRTYIDYQTNDSRNLKFRVRIIIRNKGKEKLIGYFKSNDEATEVKRVVDKTIKILKTI